MLSWDFEEFTSSLYQQNGLDYYKYLCHSCEPIETLFVPNRKVKLMYSMVTR